MWCRCWKAERCDESPGSSVAAASGEICSADASWMQELLLLSPSVYKTARDDLDKTVEPIGNNNPDLPLPFYIHLILVTGSCSKQGILSKVPWLFLGYRSLKWETHCANTDLFINIATWHLHMHEAVWARTPGVGVNRLFVSTGAGDRAMTARHQSE